MTICPNCDSTMGDDEVCPECEHDGGDDECECLHCYLKNSITN